MPPTIKVCRGRVGKCSLPGQLDVTVKSGRGMALDLAPNPSDVRALQLGWIEWDTFTTRYFDKLSWSRLDVWVWLEEQGRKSSRLTFLCYCPVDKAECHTALLIRYLVTKYPETYSVV